MEPSCRVGLGGRRRHCDVDQGDASRKTITALPLYVVEDRCGRAVLDARRHPLVTVEADQVRVELRLAAGEVGCPGCPGALRPWGWARPRAVHGLAGALRPRRGRCAGCLITHVLLPVTVLARRVYAVEVIGAALTARADRSASSTPMHQRLPAAPVESGPLSCPHTLVGQTAGRYQTEVAGGLASRPGDGRRKRPPRPAAAGP